MKIKVKTLSELKDELEILIQKDIKSDTEWTPYQTFMHCAGTIDYSRTGYPIMKPALIRNTIGKLAIKKFLKQGYMKHDLVADVPGAPAFEKQGATELGIRNLITSIDKFLSHEGAYKPHLIFGELTKEQYDQYFTMHVVNHFEGMEW